jgi:TATA-binding protein-associated factor Taf7
MSSIDSYSGANNALDAAEDDDEDGDTKVEEREDKGTDTPERKEVDDDDNPDDDDNVEEEEEVDDDERKELVRRSVCASCGLSSMVHNGRTSKSSATIPVSWTSARSVMEIGIFFSS